MLSIDLDAPEHQNRPLAKIVQDARDLREIQQRYGVIYTPQQLRTRCKPGPKPIEPEEMIDLVEQWRKARNAGLSQEKHCAVNAVSRRTLSRAISWYRGQFGEI